MEFREVPLNPYGETEARPKKSQVQSQELTFVPSSNTVEAGM